MEMLHSVTAPTTVWVPSVVPVKKRMLEAFR
jgi:hypothetical protein